MAEKFRTEPIVARTEHAVLALREDGTVWSMGHNYYGILGDPSIAPDEYRYEPRQVVGPDGQGYLKNIKYILMVSAVAAAIDEDGNLWMWGANVNGYLGIGIQDSEVHSIPSKVKSPDGLGYLTNVRKVNINSSMVAALLENGDVYTWASNAFDSANTHISTLPLKSLFSEAEDIIICHDPQSIYSLSKGKIYAMGKDARYLGIGKSGISQVTIPTPVLTEDGLPLENIVALGSHCALDGNGIVWSWGKAQYAGVGESNGILSSVRRVHGVDNIDYLSDIVYLSTTNYYAIALNSIKEAYVWRHPFEDRNTLLTTPIRYLELDNAYLVAQSAGLALSFAKSDGTVWCIGDYAKSLANNGQTGNSAEPQQIFWTPGGEPFNLFVYDPIAPPDPKPGDCCNCCGSCCRPIVLNNYTFTGPVNIHYDGCGNCCNIECEEEQET